jgi:hypothetical protein
MSARARFATTARPRGARRGLHQGLAVLGAASMLCLGLPARAQGGGGMGSGLNFDFATLVKAKPGTWADYSLSKAGGADKPVTVRYSLLERSASKIALEVDTHASKGDLLLRFDLGSIAPDVWRISGGKMKVADQSVDLPAAQLAKAPPLKATDPPGELVGTETVTTPAGTFPCKHYKKATAGEAGPATEIWVNDKVQPTGMVKFTLTGSGVDMLLTSTGAGAQALLK